jgi:hypothetical protein
MPITFTWVYLIFVVTNKQNLNEFYATEHRIKLHIYLKRFVKVLGPAIFCIRPKLAFRWSSAKVGNAKFKQAINLELTDGRMARHFLSRKTRPKSMTRLDYLILAQPYFYVGSDYSFVFPQEGPFGKRMLMTSTVLPELSPSADARCLVRALNDSLSGTPSFF